MVSKAKKLVSGSILGGTSFVLRIFISLFMTPFMIASFGDHTYGLWMLIASFSGFYGILDLGLSTAVQRYMARSVGTGDTEETNRVFNTSLIVFCGLGFLAAILAAVIAVLAPVFVKTASDVSLFRLLIILFSVNIVIGFPIQSFWGILSSNLRYDISVCIEMINVVVKAVLIIAFLKWGFGVIAVAVINVIVDLLWHVANAVCALKIAPYIRISLKYFKKTKIRMLLGYSVYVLISRIASNIKFNIDNYVISAFVGLSAVTVYSIGTRLVTYAMNFLLKLTGLMTPVFSQYEGQGDFDSIREKFFFIFKVNIYIAIFLGGLLFLLSSPFIERWIGLGYEESSIIIYILVIPKIFSMIMAPSDQLLYGISKHKFLTWVNSAEAITNLVLSLIFVRFWGIRGVAFGTAIPMFIVKVLIQPVYTAKVLGVSIFSLYAKMLTAMIKGLTVMVILYWLTKNMIAASFVWLISFGMIQTLCYALILFGIGLDPAEREQFIKGLIPRRFCKH